MATEQEQSDTAVATTLLLLLQLYAVLRLHAPSAAEALTRHNYSVRRIARETGIPRTTLGRWNQGANA